MTNKMRKKEEEQDEQLVKMMMGIDPPAKHLLGTRIKSINVIET